jgi:uncharacterized membrane protein
MLACVVLPALAIAAAEHFKPAKLLGPVVLCYGAGILAANLPGLHLDDGASRTVSSVAVPLAIPLMLFSTDLKKWLGLAKGLLLSFALACVSAVTAAGVVGWAFRERTDEWWKIAGMLVGVYVGGTANMSAVGVALDTRNETFVLLNAADVVTGGVYLLFLLSVAQRVLGKIMPPFVGHQELFAHEGESLSVWTRAHVRPMGLALAGSVAIVAVSAGASLLFFHKVDEAFTLLALTTLGIAASMSEKVRSLAGSFELGEYVLLVFCVAVGALADVSHLTGASVTLFVFVIIVMVASAVLHFGLCALFRIDVDTAIITSTATIFGPAFIGPVAAALKNRTLVGPGLSMGLAGIALGTYLGLFTAWGLRAIAG